MLHAGPHSTSSDPSCALVTILVPPGAPFDAAHLVQDAGALAADDVAEDAGWRFSSLQKGQRLMDPGDACAAVAFWRLTPFTCFLRTLQQAPILVALPGPLAQGNSLDLAVVGCMTLEAI